jgi:hypothetical protein
LRLSVLPEWLKLDCELELAVDSERLVLDFDKSRAMSLRLRALIWRAFEFLLSK